MPTSSRSPRELNPYQQIEDMWGQVLSARYPGSSTPASSMPRSSTNEKTSRGIAEVLQSGIVAVVWNGGEPSLEFPRYAQGVLQACKPARGVQQSEDGQLLGQKTVVAAMSLATIELVLRKSPRYRSVATPIMRELKMQVTVGVASLGGLEQAKIILPSRVGSGELVEKWFDELAKPKGDPMGPELQHGLQRLVDRAGGALDARKLAEEIFSNPAQVVERLQLDGAKALLEHAEQIEFLGQTGCQLAAKRVKAQLEPPLNLS